MEFKVILTIFSVIIGTAGFFPYLKGVLTKRTKPHEFTWLIWSITQGTAVAGMWIGGGGIGALALTIGTVLVFVIFLLSLFDGERNITRADVIVLCLALLVIVVWWLLKSPNLAVVMVAAIDTLGFIPTFRKSYSQPWSEDLVTWSAFAVSNLLALAALEKYNLLTMTYVSSIVLAEIILVVYLLWRRKIIPKPVTKSVLR